MLVNNNSNKNNSNPKVSDGKLKGRPFAMFISILPAPYKLLGT